MPVRSSHSQRRPVRFRHLAIEALENRRMLTGVSWIGGATGLWDAAANWSGGAVPALTADVTINPASPATVTIQAGDAESVNSVTVAAGNTLLITGGSLTTAAGLANSGTITVDAACDLTVGGSYTQSAGAALSLPGGGDPTLPTTNWLANSDFESPVVAGGSTTTKPANWGQWGSTYLSTQYAYTGSQSVAISGASSAADQKFAATPGESFTASCYAMTSASNPLTGGEYAELQIEFLNSSGTQVSTWSAPYDIDILTSSSAPGGPLPGSVGNQGWNHFSTTAVAPAGTASAMAYVDTHIYSGTGSGAAYFDDVTFGPSVAGGSALVAGSISNSGTITVGPANTIAASGTFAQTSTGTLDLQIGNSPATGIFGSVAVGGAATLAGAFQSQIVYSQYTPSTTDTFTPLTFASASGTFASYQLPSGTGYQFAASVTFTNLVLAAVPTTALTATVNTSAVLHPVATGVLGINARYKNGDTITSQAQQMLTAADLQLIRIPGGSDSDDWHFNVNYTASSSSQNNFGPLLELIAGAGATGMVTIDYGSGSPQEGAAAMAYALGSPTDNTVIGSGIQWNDTTGQWQTVNWGTVGYWASLRAAAPLATNDGLNFLRIGHAAPFANAVYWEVGNEEYGTWEVDHHGTNMPDGAGTGAQHDPATYVAFAQQFAALASEITTAAGLPAISIGIDSGDPTGLSYNDWSKDVLSDGASIGFVPSFISDHSYMHGSGIMADGTLLNGTVSDSASVDDWSTRYADYEALLLQTLSAAQAAGVQILGTEYNSTSAWDSNSSKQSVSLVNGLFIAESIGSLMESGYQGGCVWDLNDGFSTSVTSSNLLYGWRNGDSLGQIGSGGTPPSSGAYVAYPGYFGLQLASKIVQGGGQVVSAASNYSDLDVYAVQEPSGDLDLLVINANPAANLAEQFNLTGFQPSGSAAVWQYGKTQDTAQSQSSSGSSSLANFNTVLALNGSNFSYTFPAYSMTVLDLGRAVLTITASNASKTYGAPDPAFTVSYSGFAGGDNAGILGGTLAFTTSEPSGGPASVGTYQIIPAGLTSGKYTLLFFDGTLTVTQEVLTVSSTQTMTSLEASANVRVVVSLGGDLTVSNPVSLDSAGVVNVVQSGRLTVSGINAQAGATGIDLDGGTLRASAAFSTTAAITIGAGGGTVDANGNNLALAGGLSGPGGLIKIGSGTLTLSGANTYGGGTTVAAGTLIVANTTAIATGTSLTVGAGGTCILDTSAIAAPITSEEAATVTSSDKLTMRSSVAVFDSARVSPVQSSESADPWPPGPTWWNLVGRIANPSYRQLRKLFFGRS